MTAPSAKPVDGAVMFKQQCGVCHTTSAADPARQGPPLVKVLGQAAGKHNGFRYSAALAGTDMVWDESKLDAWLANPQQIVPGTTMVYRQTKAETRAAIIDFLKGLP